MTRPHETSLGRIVLHGAGPAQVAVLHGGPGGAGEVAPLARGLLARGVPCLEPLQSARSVDGQVAELRAQLAQHSLSPMALVGWSWGAWLGALLAARHPAQVSRLVLVGSAPFREADHLHIKATRQARLSPEERAEMAALARGPLDASANARLLRLMEVSDSVAPDHEPVERMQFDFEINRLVWAEAAQLRRSGALIDTLGRIRCPVAAIHGEEDAHPIAGVFDPLRAALPGAQRIALPRCGHKPWIERHAKDAFYTHLAEVLARTDGEAGPQGPDERSGKPRGTAEP